MPFERKLLVLMVLAVTVTATSAVAQELRIPELSGVWDHPSFPWFEPPTAKTPDF